MCNIFCWVQEFQPSACNTCLKWLALALMVWIKIRSFSPKIGFLTLWLYYLDSVTLWSVVCHCSLKDAVLRTRFLKIHSIWVSNLAYWDCESCPSLRGHSTRLAVYRKCNRVTAIFRGVRPFGVSLLLAGWNHDQGKPFLYQCDPSVRNSIFMSWFFCM